MAPKEPSAVVLFDSVSHALRAEKLFHAANVPCKLIPVPRNLSSDCGVCLRFNPNDTRTVKNILADKLHFEIHPL